MKKVSILKIYTHSVIYIHIHTQRKNIYTHTHTDIYTHCKVHTACVCITGDVTRGGVR